VILRKSVKQPVL